MANFGAMTLTRAGRNLLAEAQLGGVLTFTRVKAGDGFLSPETSIPDMTDVVNRITDLPINSNTITGDGMTEIECLLSNQSLEQGYWFREVGLFARIGSGEEVLYAYSNAGDEPDYIPAGGGAHAVHVIFTLITVIDQAESVTAVINDGLGFVTYPRLEQELSALFQPYSAAVGFWTYSGSDNKLRPATVPEAHKVLFRGGTGEDRLFLTFDPRSQTLGFIPMSRLLIRAERLSGGTPTMLPEEYVLDPLSGGNPTWLPEAYEGHLYGGDPQTL